MPDILLTDRTVIAVEGEDASGFLNALTTGSVAELPSGSSGFAALLTPQGKIVADFILFKMSEQKIYLDTARQALPDLMKKLNLYKLRSKISLSDCSGFLSVIAGDQDQSPEKKNCLIAVADPRNSDLGWRGLISAQMLTATENENLYHQKRLMLGIPEYGKDFAANDLFPHEALMDMLGGIDFNKGCYIGQEIVSRMQHRGTVRSRLVPVRYDDGQEWETAIPVMAGEKTIGLTGSGLKGYGIALLRLDFLGNAVQNGYKLKAGNLELAPYHLSWMNFEIPHSLR